MAGEKPAGNNPANAGGSSGGGGGGGNANKGPNNKSNNRRRSLRSKRRSGRKPEEGGSSETREARASSEPSSNPREPREPRGSRPPQPNSAKPVDKNVRDNRDRRRRRRMRAKQRGPGDAPTPVVEDILKDLPPLVPAFVYTHVLRPSMRETFEFRTEHFSKVTRRLEDFDIDLSPLYPEGGDEIKGVAYIAPADRIEFIDDDEDEENGEVNLENPNWDAEQSHEAALLDGATEGVIADDFYADLDDSVLDNYPEEDIDA